MSFRSAPPVLSHDAPPVREVPRFAPVRVRGGRHGAHRLLRHRRRALAAGLAVAAAALVAAGPLPGSGARDGERARGRPTAGEEGRRPPADLVAAPVRIADAATVRLLRPGDRVDVVAAGGGGPGGAGAVSPGGSAGSGGGGIAVIARGARVARVPGPEDGGGQGPRAGVWDGAGSGTGAGENGAGALVVLSVPRATAHRLVGTGALTPLAVTLW
ncbi:hypothetical protein [Streptomyces sp. SID8352]|uniref:hypothetical protein n=1 Tax=Streptomyces sp. SID8352 TaxID=2690338 RepID=UPI0031F6F846